MTKVKMVFIFIFSLVFLNLGLVSVHAQFTVCDFLPCNQVGSNNETANEQTVNEKVNNTLHTIADLVFIGLIGFGIVKVLLAAVKIIKSEQNTEKLQEGVATIKGVWVGLGILFVGIIGLVLITLFFNAGGILNTQVEGPSGIKNPLTSN